MLFLLCFIHVPVLSVLYWRTLCFEHLLCLEVGHCVTFVGGGCCVDLGAESIWRPVQSGCYRLLADLFTLHIVKTRFTIAVTRNTIVPRGEAFTVELEALWIAAVASLALWVLHEDLALLGYIFSLFFQLLFFCGALAIINLLISL